MGNFSQLVQACRASTRFRIEGEMNRHDGGLVVACASLTANVIYGQEVEAFIGRELVTLHRATGWPQYTPTRLAGVAAG